MKKKQKEHERFQVIHDENTGELIMRVYRYSLTCDICGYEDNSKIGSAVSKDNDGIFRCKKCQDIIDPPEPGWEWWR